MRRVVSLFLPHWSTDRLRRKIAKLSPECRDGLVLDLPLVTAVPDHGRKVIAAVDAEAKALGVRVGMTVTKARAFAPELQVVDADPEGDLQGLRDLALWAGRRYSPFVSPDAPDGIWLDITGCAGLFGTEKALLKDLHRRVAASGLARRSLWPTLAGCAHAVARHVPAGRPVTIEPGGHRTAISILPISALRLPDARSKVCASSDLSGSNSSSVRRAALAKRFGRSASAAGSGARLRARADRADLP
jgi:protein ImuB